MSKLVRIPEATLEALLREAGRDESVESFLASQDIEAATQDEARMYKRARAAYWSRFWLITSAVLSWIMFLSGPDFEGLLSSVLLTGMTVVEFKVYALFSAGDVRGATYGWWNQCLFALLFLIYGGYHGTFVTIPPQLQTIAGSGDLPMFDLQSIIQLDRIFYYTVGIVGGIGQFCLACYYFTARK